MSPRPLQFLLVEDHQDSANFLCRLLGADGHDVTCVGTYHLGLKAALKEPFDILLCDIMLPDGHGADLLAEIRQHKRVRAIAMTASAEAANLQRLRSAAFDAVLIKPIKFQELARAIDLLVGAHATSSYYAAQTST